MYFLARRLTASRNAAFLASLVFAFFPYHFAHLSHLELLFLGWMPYFFLFIHRFFDEPSLGNALGMGAFYILQVLSCAYYGQYLTVFAGLAILYYAVEKGSWRSLPFWKGLASFSALSAAVLVPYFIPFVKLHNRMLFVRASWEVKFFSAEFQHFLAVPPFNLAWGWLTGKLGAQEWQLFPGLVPIALCLVWLLSRLRGREPLTDVTTAGEKRKVFVVWDSLNILLFAFVLYLGITGGFELSAGPVKISAHKLGNPVALLLLSVVSRALISPGSRRRIGRFRRVTGPAEKSYFFITVLAWLLALGPVVRLFGREIITGPYGLLYKWAPGFRNVRVPSRFAVLMMLGLSVLSGWGFVALGERMRSSRMRNLAAAVIGLLIVLEYLAIPIPLVSVPVKDRIPEIYSAVAGLPPDAALIELPMPGRDDQESEEASAVYYSLYHRRSIVNGYSGYSPPGYRVIREAMEQFPSGETFELLENLKVGFVLVHTSGFRADRGLEIMERIGDFGLRAELAAKAGGDFLFRLTPPKREVKNEEPLRPAGDRTKWRASASLNQRLTGLAFDGDLRTGWTTGYPQRKGDFFEVDLGEDVAVKRIVLFLDTNPLDFPRSFRLEGSPDGESWIPLCDKAGFFPALDLSMIEDFERYVVPADFAPVRVRAIRFILTDSHEARHWSINEVGLYD